ncbi:substrate-binding domain-containing protein [Kitasatospora viridis]|uniref:PBP domain-containing protein n=1 Tax=Kitasatospora viridis TaxID=281105 RepID=A0A561UH29_9ACTN|nr:substrate-binding domain-containing protein [Kitasatospora viridis]TWF98670.1 hypothetical protein FHX73_112491 [Kitasatospora viridis]
MRYTAAKLFAAVAIATSLTTVAAGTALADPTGTPAAQDIVGTGSDTIQAVLNQLSTDYNASLTAAHDTTSPRLYSWDATGSSPIVPKTGASSITRPNGSGAGISALNANTSSTVNFARSSRGPVSTDPTSDDFVTLAEDGVAWAAPSGGVAPSNLSTNDLYAIYVTCSITNWNQITDVSGYTGPNAPVHAYLPQTNSGTRAFFLGAINTANPGVAATPGSCVQSTLVEENQGVAPSAFASDNDALAPYSAAHYIGQTVGGHTTSSDAPGTYTIRSIDGVAPEVSNALNGDFTATNYGRNVYDVVRDADWTANGGSNALQNIFGTNGYLCNNATAEADIASYGFQVLPAGACGSVTHN